MSLSEPDYIRQRLEPRTSDPLYLHLTDLAQFIRQAIPKHSATVLDFGAGGSPYRSLFKSAVYYKADIPGEEDLDFAISEEGKLPEDLAECDVVLSTQVLEHVIDPVVYVKECFRALKPGGTLILTTHGIFEDHPCPLDLQRWTADGLVRLVNGAGFMGISAYKLTTGPRAILFLLDRQLNRFPGNVRTISRNPVALSFQMLRMLGQRRVNEFADRYFAGDRVVLSEGKRPGIYIALGIIAKKRAGAERHVGL